MRRLAILLLLATTPALAQEGPNAEPSSMDTLFDQSSTGNVAQAAVMSLAAGERELKRAAKLEEKLAELDGEKAAKQKTKIAQAYESAAASFMDAIRTKPELQEAYLGLGKAYLAVGKNAEALQVTKRGLWYAPADDAMFAAWTEAVMNLDLLGDATKAYTENAAANPARAGVVMAALKDWLAAHQANPGAISPEDVARLEGWIAAQESGS
jgi:tetratricopeptide (TPR) repeat protein